MTRGTIEVPLVNKHVEHECRSEGASVRNETRQRYECHCCARVAIVVAEDLAELAAPTPCLSAGSASLPRGCRLQSIVSATLSEVTSSS